MSTDNEKLFKVVDILMSEYGQKPEYWLSLPGDVISGLLKAIQHRKGAEARAWTKLIGAACAAGFSGKLDKLAGIFSDETEESEEVDAGAWKGQVKSMWMRMKTKNQKNLSPEDYKKLNEEFEAKWASGENIEF